MDASKAKILQAAVLEALKSVELEHGVKFSPRGGKYTATTLTMKLEVGEVSKDGNVASKEEQDFRSTAHWYGIDPAALGKSFVSGGRTYRITGLKSRSPRRPILAVDSAGRTFVFTTEAVAKFFPKSSEARP
jgi:hypothetical protein